MLTCCWQVYAHDAKFFGWGLIISPTFAEVCFIVPIGPVLPLCKASKSYPKSAVFIAIMVVAAKFFVWYKISRPKLVAVR